MDKVLINLYIPTANRSFDLFVPSDLIIRELTKVIINGVVYMCEGAFYASGREMLILTDPETLMDPDCTLADYGVMNGAKLMLI